MKNRLWRNRFGIAKGRSPSVLYNKNRIDLNQDFFASVAFVSEKLNNCLIQIESQLLETNVINNSTEIMNISAVLLDIPYEVFLPSEEESQGTSYFSTSNETINFLVTTIVKKVEISINKKFASFDCNTLATAIVKQFKLPEIHLDKYGILDNMIENKVGEGFKNAISELNSEAVWVKPKEYMRKYGLTPTTLWRYKQSGKISKNTIRGAGKGRRYNITIPPIC